MELFEHRLGEPSRAVESSAVDIIIIMTQISNKRLLARKNPLPGSRLGPVTNVGQLVAAGTGRRRQESHGSAKWLLSSFRASVADKARRCHFAAATVTTTTTTTTTFACRVQVEQRRRHRQHPTLLFNFPPAPDSLPGEPSAAFHALLPTLFA